MPPGDAFRDWTKPSPVRFDAEGGGRGINGIKALNHVKVAVTAGEPVLVKVYLAVGAY